MTFRRLFLAFLVLSPLACKKDEGGRGGESSTTTMTSASNDESEGCTLGTEGCACIEGGLCVTGLVCLSDTCVDPGPLGTDGGEEGSGPKPEDSGGVESSGGVGDSTGGETGGGAGGSCVGNCGDVVDQGDGTFCFCDPVCASAGDCCSDYESACPGQCLYNSDCDGADVCSASSQECVPPYFHTYDVRVTYWKDGTCCCWDGAGAECLADVYFKAIYGGVEVYGPSTTNNNVLETGWFEESFEIDIDEIKGLSVLFYDNDTFGDTYLIGVCSGAGVCSAVTETDLHNGYTEWNLLNDPEDSKQYHVIVTYTAK